MKYYSVSLDLLSKIVSAFILVLFAGIIGHQLYNFLYSEKHVPIWVPIMIGGILLAIFFITYLYKINGYIINEDELIVKRPVGNKVFPFSEIRSVEVPVKESMRWTIRTFGNGGLFGYVGKFANTTYGNMTWYATRRSNYILIKIKDEGWIVITPDDLSLANDLKAKLN